MLIALYRHMASLLEEATVVKQGWLLKRGLLRACFADLVVVVRLSIYLVLYTYY